MITPAARERVASELVDARREGRSLARFPGPVPATMADAYQIQDVAISRWPDAVVGWKIGYIPADRRSPGDPDRLVGPIWSRQCHATEDAESPVEVDIFPSGFAAVEGELVIRLRQELPGCRWTALHRRGSDPRLSLVALDTLRSGLRTPSDWGWSRRCTGVSELAGVGVGAVDLSGGAGAADRRTGPLLHRSRRAGRRRRRRGLADQPTRPPCRRAHRWTGSVPAGIGAQVAVELPHILASWACSAGPG
jgi:hypothetical protein